MTGSAAKKKKREGGEGEGKQPGPRVREKPSRSGGGFQVVPGWVRVCVSWYVGGCVCVCRVVSIPFFTKIDER